MHTYKHYRHNARSRARPPAGSKIDRGSASAPTIKSLRAATRLQDRRRRAAERVAVAMRGGDTLHLHYEHGVARWRLSFGGPLVPADVAAIVIANPYVVSVGDALFPGMPAQTWRWVE